MINTASATAVITDTPRDVVSAYLDYWNCLKPKNHYEYELRWFFAFMSIRAQWKSNCTAFLALKNLGQEFTHADVSGALHSSRIGMYDVRIPAVWDFHQSFWRDPNRYYPLLNEGLVTARDRLADEVFGIGLAKTAFVFEMTYPASSGVACLDTHLLQLYNCTSAVTPKTYHELEAHWCNNCKAVDLPSPMVRHIYWDKLRNQTSTKYWSYVLEKRALNEISRTPTSTRIARRSSRTRNRRCVA